MSVFSGPQITNDGLVFYIDAKNIRSNIPNQIKDLISGEEKNSTAITENGYFYSNYGQIEKFTNLNISDLSAITVNVLLSHEVGKSGMAFSINSDDVINNTPAGIATNYEYIDASTQGTVAASVGPGYSSSSSTAYDYIQAATDGISVQDQGLTYSTNSVSTHYEYIDASTQGTVATDFGSGYSSSSNIAYDYIQAATDSLSVRCLNLATQFELSLYADASQVIATHKNANNTAVAIASSDVGTRTQYSVIFRNFSANSVPISLYKNGELASDTGSVSGVPSPFENYGISLFNKLNSDFGNYGVRAVSIYNNELSNQDIILINRIEPK
jgi:hypothetical protein